MSECSIGGCDRPHRAKGFCNKHYQRFMKHGDPLEDGKWKRRWLGDSVGYNGLHDRLARDKGKAALQVCVHCGSQAAHWAYDHLDPDEKTWPIRNKLMPFSLDPDHYISLCSTCHKQLDMAHV